MKIIHRRRGTAIIQTPKGILLTADKNKLYCLPGGGAESGEPVKDAIIREVEEETGLKPKYTRYLFRHVGTPYKKDSGVFVKDFNTVFLVKADGIPRPMNEVKKIGYYTPNSNLKIYKSQKEIIDRFLNR